MYIEFIGVPGAGKTTLVEEVRKLFEREGIQCATRATFFSKNRKWKYKLLWMLLHPQYIDFSIAVLLYKLSRVKGSDFRKFLTRLHEHQKLQYQLAHMKKGSVAVWDTGFAHWFSSHVIAGVLGRETAVDFIKKRLPPNTLLVFIDTPTDVAVERMQEREARLRATKGVVGWKPDAVEEKNRHEAFAEGRRVQETLFDLLATKGIATVKIDGTKPLTENAIIVCECIKKQL